MAGVKLSALPDADPTDGTELVEIVQGGSNVKVTISEIFNGVSYEEGEFTITLGGVSESIQGLAYYAKFGNCISITIPGLTEGTSNSSLFWISGIPAALRPSSAILVPCASTAAFLINGSAPAIVEQVSIYLNVIGYGFFFHNATNVWTYPSTKGMAYAVSFTYRLV